MSDTVLETQRLILRHWRDSDLEPMAAINQDPQVMEHFPAPKTLEETRNFIAINRPLYDQVGYFIYAVELKNTHELIGFVGLQPVGIEMPFAPAVEILWRIGTKYWGKGYATEAAQAVVEHAFNNLGLDKLVAFTTTTNKRSEKLMQSLGFVRSESEDFDHPKIAKGHKLQRHIFYRKHRAFDRSTFDFSILEKIIFFKGVDTDNIGIKLLEGMTNVNYILTLRGQHYVLRVPSKSKKKPNFEYSLDRKQEMFNLKIVSDLKLYPEYIYYDAETGIQLRPYIEGVDIEPEMLNDQLIVRFANVLKKLHTSQRLFAENINAFPPLDRYRHLLAVTPLKDNRRFWECFNLMDEIQKVVAKHAVSAIPCHNDAHPGNFLKTDTDLLLMDWEYAGNGDPMWDLAYLSKYAEFNRKQEQILLDAYFDKSFEEIHKLRMFVYKPAVAFMVLARSSVEKFEESTLLENSSMDEWWELSLSNTLVLLQSDEFKEAFAELKKFTNASV